MAACTDVVKLSTNIKVERGAAPAAGFEESAPVRIANVAVPVGEQTFLASIASARCEVQTLFDLASELGDSLSLAETLALVTSRLKALIPHESAVLWVRNGQELEAYYVEGANRTLFETLRIPLGEGLAGWVAQNTKPILNGNPAVEPGYLNDPSKFTTLRSALAVPLTGVTDFVGVLAFYRADRDAFSKDHQRILMGVASKLATSIENSLSHQALVQTQTHDLLTGLPNLTHLLERFDAELDRSRRSGSGLAVVICDINGLKAFNSRYGYESGDRLLRELATGLRNMFRDYDLVARIGGDEFAIVIPEISPETATARVREIHTVAERAGEVLAEESRDLLSISIGEAFYPKDGDSVEDLLCRADRRMSLAKKERGAKSTPASALPPRRPAAVAEKSHHQQQQQPVPVAS